MNAPGALAPGSTHPVAGLVSTSHEYDHLARVYLPIAGAVLAIILLTIAFSAIRFRRRSPEQAARWHEHHLSEGIYAIVLAGIVAFLLFETFGSENKIDTVANREKGGVTVDVTGARWDWTFYYPRYRITVHSGSSGRRAFVVPVNEPIHFYLSSVDVIHSFWIPALRYKHDNIPGETMLSTLTFTRSGIFPGQCAEYCGLNHSEMVFDAKAVSSAAFSAWAASGGRAPV